LNNPDEGPELPRQQLELEFKPDVVSAEPIPDDRLPRHFILSPHELKTA
jgi:hypothetical protein